VRSASDNFLGICVACFSGQALPRPHPASKRDASLGHCSLAMQSVGSCYGEREKKQKKNAAKKIRNERIGETLVHKLTSLSSRTRSAALANTAERVSQQL